MSYLVWRDSKAAIIFFVKNNNISDVIENFKKVIKKHPNYIRFENSHHNDSWLNYKIHIKDDRNKLVDLSVMFYHIPKKDFL